ncbi:hypothetical protein [Pseudomonas koreensis]|jgi:hypothetical protein|uniref:hypothetical protein n=1 Tax=Pseudomonas koreensis TaxID=198620 RepID=UPI001B328BBD|nr:hypothetical protein [Pseudomonas koreensis]MBP3998299.1 hypothetical protein [Pseudomonas koreensis]
MQTAIQTRNALNAAGFTLSLGHALFTDDSGQFDPRSSGFVAVHTGGGCMALRRDSGDFYILITSDDGSDVPDMQDWNSSLIGVYRDSDDEEIACITAMEWQQVVSD